MLQSTVDRILQVAAAELGYVEGPRSNETKYAAEIAPLTQFQPWCGVFVSWCFQHAGVPLPPVQPAAVPGGGFAYCPFAVTWARNHGEAVAFEDAQPGDVVLFDWQRNGSAADHVGIVERPPVGAWVQTLEGNTASSNGGDQSNGGGVYRKSRNRADVQCVWRPALSEPKAAPAPAPVLPAEVYEFSEDDVKTTLLGSGVANGFGVANPRWDPGFGRPPVFVAAAPNGLVNLDAPIGAHVEGNEVVLDILMVKTDGGVHDPFDVHVAVA